MTKTAAVTDYTITSDVLALSFKETLTDGIGSFSFTLPTKKGLDYVYHDIALNDIIEFYIGYDTVPATANFIDKVGKIQGTATKDGYVRRISGLSQGEVLLNQYKTNAYYYASNAGLIVANWAATLGLGAGKVTADANQPVIEVKTKTYFDLMREISDYWINAGNQIKKDFFVDVDDDLVWKVRPIRTAGVETLTVGENILDYVVTQSKDPVRNNITVYGSADKPLPSDKDWTETDTTGWTLLDATGGGSIQCYNGGNQVGADYIACEPGAAYDITHFKREVSPTVNIRTINSLDFWTKFSSAFFDVGPFVRLHAPTSASYFQANVSTVGAWTLNTYSLGPKYEYDAATNPTGVWTKTGTPNWWYIEEIAFYADMTNNNNYYGVDGLHFYPTRWSGTVTNAASITSYDQRDLEITDDKLHTDSACEQRAETLLYRLKDAPSQIDVTVTGNNNILVGDRLSMTIPAENITAVNYDVTTVDNALSPAGWFTRATMVNSGNIRGSIVTSPMLRLRELGRKVRSFVGKEEIY